MRAPRRETLPLSLQAEAVRVELERAEDYAAATQSMRIGAEAARHRDALQQAHLTLSRLADRRHA